MIIITDGTLTYFDKNKEDWRNRMISEWSGKSFELASEGKNPRYKTVDDEREFFKRFYRHLLIEEEIKEEIDARSAH